LEAKERLKVACGAIQDFIFRLIDVIEAVLSGAKNLVSDHLAKGGGLLEG